MSSWLLGKRPHLIATQRRGVLAGLALVTSLLAAAGGVGGSYHVAAASNTATATYLTSSPNPSTSGQAVTFAVSVVPPSATGTVTVLGNSTTLATVRLSSGNATFTTSTLSSGSHTITATYGGDASHGSSTSAPFTQMVRAVSTTSVGSSANPSTYSQALTLTATVAPAQATGTVTFRDGSATLGSAGLAQGTASLTISSLAAYTHSITASYGGDATYAGSASATLLQNVVQPASPTMLTGGHASAGGAVSVPAGRTAARGAVGGSTAAGRAVNGSPGQTSTWSTGRGPALDHIGLSQPEAASGPSSPSDLTAGADTSATLQAGSPLVPAVLAALALLAIGGLILRRRRRAARFDDGPWTQMNHD